MPEWSKAPLALRFYIVLMVAWSLVVAALIPNGFALFAIGFSFVVAYFLLRGVRWLWLLVTGFTVFGLLTDPLLVGHTTWYGVAGGIVELGLLLAPQTRRYFVRDAVAAMP